MIPFIGSSCVLCNATVKRKISLCEACEADLPIISHACSRCGIPLSESLDVCGECLKLTPMVDYNLSLYHYETPVDYLIGELKFNKKLSYADILGYLLAKELLKKEQENFPEIILPVPLYKSRLVERGFNQSLEIARVVSRELKVPIDYKLMKKYKTTQAQSTLKLNQRKSNIKGSFKLEKIPPYQHVVIIDDVVTTGATSNELATVLKAAGIKKVGVWSIARAILR